MAKQEKILFVDDEENVLKALRRLLIDEEYESFFAASGPEGLQIMQDEADIQIVVSDYRMPDMNGVDFLKAVCERWPDTVRIVLSGYADTGSLVSAINEGQIYRFIPKPWNDDELKITISKAFEVYCLWLKNRMLADELQKTNEELKEINENLEERVRERTEEVLFQNKVLDRERNILDSLPVGVVGIDRSGMIVQCNKRAYELLGGLKSTMSGNNYQKVFSGELVAFINKIEGHDFFHEKLAIGDLICRIKGCMLHGDTGQEGKILVIDDEDRQP